MYSSAVGPSRASPDGKLAASVHVAAGDDEVLGTPTNPLRIVVLVPAYNEAESIGATLDGLMAQSRQSSLVVLTPNGCTDTTTQEARRSPVAVMELPRLQHRKSKYLNRVCVEYAYDADVVICLHADTVLPPNAVEAWASEFAVEDSPRPGGSSSKFTC